MRRIIVLLSLLVALGIASSAGAAVYNFSPMPSSDMYDLDHYRYYTWGINWGSHAGETIIGATLTFKNIWDWRVEPDNLYTHLLDWAPIPSSTSNVRTFWDNQGGGDNFGAYHDGLGGGTYQRGNLVGNWSDPVGGRARNFDLVYNFSTLGLIGALNTYANNDGRFGFGIDPDCHYYNGGVSLCITTATTPPQHAVPEPATLALFGLGAAAMGMIRRRK